MFYPFSCSLLKNAERAERIDLGGVFFRRWEREWWAIAVDIGFASVVFKDECVFLSKVNVQYPNLNQIQLIHDEILEGYL